MVLKFLKIGIKYAPDGNPRNHKEDHRGHRKDNKGKPLCQGGGEKSLSFLWLLSLEAWNIRTIPGNPEGPYSEILLSLLWKNLLLRSSSSCSIFSAFSCPSYRSLYSPCILPYKQKKDSNRTFWWGVSQKVCGEGYILCKILTPQNSHTCGGGNGKVCKRKKGGE